MGLWLGRRDEPLDAGLSARIMPCDTELRIGPGRLLPVRIHLDQALVQRTYRRDDAQALAHARNAHLLQRGLVELQQGRPVDIVICEQHCMLP